MDQKKQEIVHIKDECQAQINDEDKEDAQLSQTQQVIPKNEQQEQEEKKKTQQIKPETKLQRIMRQLDDNDEYYYTQQGQCFHNESCHTLFRSKKIAQTNKKGVILVGLRPCKICFGQY